MNNILRHTLIPALAALCLTSAFAADEPICGTWRFWDQSVREMRPDGSSGQPGRPADSKWLRLSPPGANEPVYQIKDGSGRVIEALSLRNSATQLWSVKERKAKFTAVRIAAADVAALQAPGKAASPKKSAAKTATPAAPQNPTPQAPAAAPNGRQMTFAPDWMPNRQDISREFAKSLV